MRTLTSRHPGRDLGKPITKSEVDQSLGELKVFQNWFAANVLHTDDKSGSSAVLVLPVGPSKPTYRDIYLPPSARTGIDALSFGAFLRLPQLVLPSKSIPFDDSDSLRDRPYR